MNITQNTDIINSLKKRNLKSNELFEYCIKMGLNCNDCCNIVRTIYPDIKEITNINEGLLMQVVKTFDDACIMLGIDINKFNQKYKDLLKSQIAEIKLKLIIKVLNSNWVVNFNYEYFYYTPVFEYDKNNNFFLYVHDVGCTNRFFMGFEWHIKTRKLTEYCGTQFIDLWNDYLIKTISLSTFDDILIDKIN